jgi:hypothetical protein
MHETSFLCANFVNAQLLIAGNCIAMQDSHVFKKILHMSEAGLTNVADHCLSLQGFLQVILDMAEHVGIF